MVIKNIYITQCIISCKGPSGLCVWNILSHIVFCSNYFSNQVVKTEYNLLIYECKFNLIM